MKENIVCAYIHDTSPQAMSRATYIPNTLFLNQCIEVWAKSGISFCGIVHSHPVGQNELSSADKEYIYRLYYANPWLEDSYYPIITEGRQMIVYQAKKKKGVLLFHEEPLILIER